MLKAIITFLAVASTVFFVNDKFSKAVRVIAFSESESKNSAIYSFFMMESEYMKYSSYQTPEPIRVKVIA